MQELNEFHNVGKSLRKIVDKLSAENDAMLVKMQLNWIAIVGSDFAGKCTPEKITYSTRGGMLMLRVASQHALEISYLSGIILEKIAVYFGYKAVAELKLRQVLKSQEL
jgi:hypothetical protein